MNIKKVFIFALLLALLLLTANPARAASDDSRYFVKTTSQFWKKSFGVRQSFDNGFTTELSEWQIRWAKVWGVEVEPVKKLNILPATTVSVAKKIKPLPRTPADQVPAGIKIMYNDLALAKTSGGADINIAVLDTGVSKIHPDLKSRIKECKDFSSPADALIDGKCDDKNGHGTHISGIISADGGLDGKGIYGMAPEANLFEYKVCSNSGTCFADDVAAAIRLAVDGSAQIINLSLGSDLPSQLIIDAINYAVSKDVLVVAAAGNDGPYQGSIDFPASDVNVLSVGAVDSALAVPDWSARGMNSKTTPYVRDDKDMEFSAPGVNVESTWKDGGYAILSGTSMSAPHITGLAAKLWLKDEEHPAAKVRELLHKISSDIGAPGDDDASGWGLPHL